MKLVHGLLLTGAAFLVVFLITLYQASYFDFENKLYDVRYGLRVKPQHLEDIVVVEIDVRSLEKLGRFQNWPRGYYARAINYLKGAKVLGIDILWSEPDSLNPLVRQTLSRRLDSLGLPAAEILPLFSFDNELARSIKAHGRVVLVASYEEVEAFGGRVIGNRVIEPIRPLRDAALAVGIGNVVRDLDGVVRRAVPLWDLQGGRTYPTFALQMARHGAREVPADTTGPKYIAYVGREGSFRRVSFYDVLEERIPAEFFNDKTVLIGATALGLSDVNPAPFAPTFAGVELHANVIWDLEHDLFIARSPTWVTLLLVLLFCAATVVFFYFFRPLTGAILAVLFFFIFLVVNQICFAANFWLEIVRPAYGLLLATALTLGYRFLFEERQKRMIKETFGRYVSKDVVEQLVAKPPVLGGTKIEASVLFADIRNFTTLSERLSPEALVKILNDYFSLVTQDIQQHRGMVDKFIGDGIMAVFGAPMAYPEHALMAVKTALAMKARMEEIREKYPIRIGIGINSGTMICGNIGSHDRMDYTVIGDNVNLASRLEALTKEYDAQVIVSEATFMAVAAQVEGRELGWAKIKGKEKEVHIYEVTGLKANA